MATTAEKSWFRRHWIITALAVLMLIGIFSSKDNRFSGAPESTTPKTYTEILKISGNGPKKSEPFTVKGERFKVKYTCTGTLCQAFLKETDGNPLGVQLVMNTPGSVTDEGIFYGSGEYYLEVNSIGKYTLTVEDYL